MGTLNVGTRFTALDYANKDRATNDEIMVDKGNGTGYYKKKDGTVVKIGESKLTGSKKIFDKLINVLANENSKIYAEGSLGSYSMVTYIDANLNKAIFENGATVPLSIVKSNIKTKVAPIGAAVKISTRPEDMALLSALTNAAIQNAPMESTTALHDAYLSDYSIDITCTVDETDIATATAYGNFNEDLIIDSNMGSWSTQAASLTNRYGGAAVMGSGLSSSFVFGGRNTSAVALSSSEYFSSTTWSAKNSMNVERYGVKAVGATSTDCLAIGGTKLTNEVLLTFESYNGLTWSIAGSLLVARKEFQATGLPNAALIAGGVASGTTIDTTEKVMNLTSKISSLINCARRAFAMSGTTGQALIYNGSAGVDSSRSAYTVEKMTNNLWSITGITPTYKLYNHGSATIADSAVSFGGISLGSSPMPQNHKYINNVWMVVAQCNEMHAELQGCGKSNSVFAIGGRGADPLVTSPMKVNELFIWFDSWDVYADAVISLTNLKLLATGTELSSTVINTIAPTDKKCYISAIEVSAIERNAGLGTEFQTTIGAIKDITSLTEISELLTHAIESTGIGAGGESVQYVTDLSTATANFVFKGPSAEK